MPELYGTQIIHRTQASENTAKEVYDICKARKKKLKIKKIKKIKTNARGKIKETPRNGQKQETKKYSMLVSKQQEPGTINSEKAGQECKN